jgi:hypothetical protein
MLSSNGWRALALSLALVPQAMADICATLEAGGIEKSLHVVQVLDNLRHLRCTGWSCNACWLEITACRGPIPYISINDVG